MEEKAQKFMTFIGENYERLNDKMTRYCMSKGIPFDEDVFGNTIIKIYDKILKDGMDDDTDAGFEGYFFMSFKTNLLRERQYSRNKSSDDNIQQDELGEVYDRYYNDVNDSATVKLQKDLRIDYRVLKLLLLIEQNFDAESYRLVKLKFLESLTYKQLAERTGIKDCRNKVLAVLQWLREHSEEIEKDIECEFQDDYGDWLEFN